MTDYWKKIKPKLIKSGFVFSHSKNNIADELDFLSKLATKDMRYINNKILESPIMTINENNEVIFDKHNKHRIFKLGSFITKGAYNKIYDIVFLDTNKTYIYRSSNIGFIDDEHLINNYIETFCHAFFSIYQKKYLLDTNYNCILNLKQFGYNPKERIISGITDKMNGTLYEILHLKQLSQPQKVAILIKGLNQIIDLLDDLQTKFKFVHNDLKANNVFFKLNKEDIYELDNIHFYITDFDGCRFEINNYVIMGNKALSLNNDFNPRKDLFLLMYSLYYMFNDRIWMDTFFNKFNLRSSWIDSMDSFTDLYYYNIDEMPVLYEPKNMRIFLEKL